MSVNRIVHLKQYGLDKGEVCPPKVHQNTPDLETEEWFGMTEAEKRNILRKAENCRNE